MVDGRVLGVLGAIGFLEPNALNVRSDRKRRLLAGLALANGREVSSGRLVDIVWGDEPPRTARHALQVYVSELRSQLGTDGAGLVTTTFGYRLDLASITTDVLRAEVLIGGGRAASVDGRFDEAICAYQQAIDLWRGTPYEGIEDDDVVRAERARLEALHTAARDEMADAYLALGRHAELIPHLRAMTIAQPFHERAYEQLMIALYRSGRQTDALDVFQSARHALAEQVGLDPGRRLVALERAVLRHDVTLLEPESSPAGDPWPSQRFVGRSDEVRMLSSVASAARSECDVRVVLVGGEPGIGKTRLVDEWVRQLDGWTVLRGRCPDEGNSPALWPIAEALRPFVDRIDQRHEVLAPLWRLLGRADKGPEPDGAAPAAAFELSDAIAELVVSLADGGAIVLVVDDAHWVDATTAAAIVRLSQRRPPGQVVIVLTHRIADADRSAAFDRAVGHVVREPGTVRIDLGPLPEQDEIAYLAGLGLDLPVVEIERIRRRSEGNPLYLGELARLVSSRRLPTSSLPDSLHRVLEARFALLGEAADVLSIAAIIGREFDTGLLARLGTHSPDEISRALAAGARTGITAVRDDGGWVFTHALLAEAGVARLDGDRRRRIHLRLAELLDGFATLEPAVRVVEVARHRLAALPLGEPVVAGVACLRAGDDLLAAFAYEEAAKMYAAARGALEHDPAATSSTARALVGEAEALAAAGSGERAIELVERALPLIDRRRDAELFALAVRVLVLHRSTAAALGDERLARLLEEAIDILERGSDWLAVQLRTDLAMLHYRTDDSGRSEVIARDAFELAAAGDEPLARALAATGLHQAIWRPATLPERLELATTAIATARQVGNPWHESMAFAFRASDAWELGDFERVERDLGSALALADLGRRPRFRWIARSWTALLDLYRGDRDGAEAGFAEALAAWGPAPNPDAVQCYFAQQLTVRLIDQDTSDVIDVLREVAAGDPDTVSWRALLSYPLVMAGLDAEAHEVLDHVLAAGVDHLREDVTHHVVLAMLSEAAAALARPDVAAVVAPLLTPFAERRILTNVFGGGGICWGSVAHQLGLCSTVLGDVDAAHRWFGLALDHHTLDGAVPFRARTVAALDRLG